MILNRRTDRGNLAGILAERMLGGNARIDGAMKAEWYKSLDLSTVSDSRTRLISTLSLGSDAPVLMFAGIGILPESGTIRGYQYGDLLGTQVVAGIWKCAFPWRGNINYSLFAAGFFIAERRADDPVYDFGVVCDDLTRTTPENWHNSVGLGFRFITLCWEKTFNDPF